MADQKAIDARIAELEARLSSKKSSPVMDDAAIDARIAELEAKNPHLKEKPEEMGMLEALGRKATKGFTFGLDPVISGAYEGVAQGIGALSGGAELGDALDVAKMGFQEGRQYKIDKNKEASKKAGLLGTVAEIGGGIVPVIATGGAGILGAPATAGRAIGTGALMGVGEAAGYAESPTEALTDVGMGAAGGGLLYGAGKALSKGGGLIKDAFSRKADGFSDTIQAGKDLGVKLTPGSLSPRDSTVRKLESSMEQSPSFGGALFRREVRPGRETVRDALEGYTEKAGTLDPFEVGAKAKNDLLTEFSEKLTPLKGKFEDIKKSTGFIDVPEKSLNKVAENIAKIPEIRIGQGQAYASKALQYAENLKNVKSADELKQLRTIIGREIDLAKRQGDTNASMILGKVFDRVDRLEQNSITRAALAQAKTGAEGKKIAKGLLTDLKDTRKSYGALMNDAKKFADNAGLGKVKTPESFISALEQTPNETIAKKLFDSNDFASLKYLKENKPNIYQDVKALKWQDIVKKSSNKDEISPVKLIKNLEGYNKGVLEELLGDPTKVKEFEAIKKLVNADPGKYSTGGSMTPEGLQLEKWLNPIFQGQELLRYGAYKAGSSRLPGLIQKGGEGLLKATPTLSRVAADREE